MVDLSPYRAQIDAAWKHNELTFSRENPREAFLDMLSAQGFKMPQGLRLNVIDRIDGPDDRHGKKSGWYVYREVEYDGKVLAIANYGDWKAGFSDLWTSKKQSSMSESERKFFYEAQEEMRAKVEEETRKRNEEAAIKASEIWRFAPQIESHPYLEAKKVGATKHLKLSNNGKLIIPMAHDTQVVSLQFISPDGSKKFLTGGRVKGAWFSIEGNETIIYIAEGYATGKSVNEATGNAVYICFNANNIYEVTEYVKRNHPDSHIIIAGDDDINSTGNAGRTKAEQAANGLDVDVIFPPQGGDFNDYHVRYGIDALKELLRPSFEKYTKPVPVPEKMDGDIIRPMGILGAIYDYYKSTDGFKQYGFAIQTALGVCSVVLGRSYKTNYENYTPLFLLNVGDTATGKEHIKKVSSKILVDAGHIDLLAGDGYTAGSAVISTLIDKPRHLVTIDELGRYLEASAAKNGYSMQREANTKLMEAIGRSGGIMYPMNYSTMSSKKDSASLLKNRIVHNPSISLLAMTTPLTFYNTIDVAAIQDGFINRFIIYTSDVEPQVRIDKEPLAVPDHIIDWIHRVTERYGKTHSAGIPAEPIVLQFSTEALALKNEFAQHCVDQIKLLKKFSMEGLPGRSAEMAMKISLICALSERYDAQYIEKRHMEWAIWWVKKCLEQTMDKLKINISSSDFEGMKKEVLFAIREQGSNGVTWSVMQKTTPYSKYKIKELKEILQSLKDAELVIDEHVQQENGKGVQLWTALK